MSIVQQAVFLCRNQRFHRWVEKQRCYVWGVIDEVGARRFILDACNIASRAELATNSEAREKFEALLRRFQQQPEMLPCL